MNTVIYEKREGIAYVTMNRPEVLNVYNRDMLLELEQVWYDAARDNEVRVIIFTGAGERAFSAGFDLKAAAAGIDVYQHSDGTFIPSLQTTGPQSFGLMKPIIAAVHGYCLGGGTNMIATCDIVVADENAKFGFSMVKRGGFTPGSACAWIVNRIPLCHAMQLLLTGDTIDAQTAYKIGLVNQVVSPQALMPTVEGIARTIADNPPATIKAIKEEVWRSFNNHLDQAIRMTVLIDDELMKSGQFRKSGEVFAEKKGDYKAKI